MFSEKLHKITQIKKNLALFSEKLQKKCKSASPVGLDGPDKYQVYQLVGEIRWWCSGDNLGDNLDDELGDDGDDPEVECIK